MSNAATPSTPERDPVVQVFGALVPVRLGLDEDVRLQSVAALNHLLAHTTAIRDLYKKAHWQASGALFYELHLLFDKHSEEQEQLMDAVAEKVRTLGGFSMALASDVVTDGAVAAEPASRPVARVTKALRELPQAIADYIDAENAGDAEAVSRCFEKHGFVQDEGRVFEGRGEIRYWKEDRDSDRRLRLEPMAVTVSGGVFVVVMRQTGDPRSYACDHAYLFTLGPKKVFSLET